MIVMANTYMYATTLLLFLMFAAAFGNDPPFLINSTVDIEALYFQSVWGFNVSENDVIVLGDTLTTLTNFSLTTNVSDIQAFRRSFMVPEGISYDLGTFKELCPTCAGNIDSELLTYTFAAWVSLKPNSFIPEKACLPVYGAVNIYLRQRDSEAVISAQTDSKAENVGQYLTAEKVGALVNIFTWNHFAIVVKNRKMIFYCNGFECDGTSFQGQPEKTPSKLILNPTTDNRGCNQVAYENITLWDKALSVKEIRALRFAPFITTPNTTMPPKTTMPPNTSPEGSYSNGNDDGGGEVTSGDSDNNTPAQPVKTTKIEAEATTGAIVLPTGKPEEKLDFLINQFEVGSGAPISPEHISAGVDAALSIFDAIKGGTNLRNSNSSYESDYVAYEGLDEDEVVVAIGIGEDLFNKMSAAGLTAPVSTGSGQARFDMIEFLNTLIDFDLDVGDEDTTNLDGSSLLVSLESFMSTFFKEKRAPNIKAHDKLEHVHVYEQSGLDKFMTPVYINFVKSRNQGPVVSIEFPAAAYEDYRKVRLVSGAVYDCVKLSLPRKITTALTPGESVKDETVEVISPIISLMVNYNSSSLKKNVTFLHLHREKHNGEEVVCVFLTFGDQTKWETTGCVTNSVNSTATLCHCNHLTNFALLMATDGLVLNSWHNKTATLLTYATLSVSVLCLLAGLIILVKYRRVLKSKRMQILRHTALSMLLAHLLFLFGDFALEEKSVCTVVATLLHYLFLTVFCWMFIMGFQLYTKVRRAHKTQVDFLYYILFGWGFPVGIVGISVSSNTDGYGTVGACWLNPEDNTIWAFVGPAFGILVFNGLVMILVMRSLVNVKGYKDKETIDRVRSAAKGVIIMLPVLGITWVVGIVVQYSLAFVYMFILFNGLQGLFLFLFHVVFNREVRNAISGKNKVKESSSNATTAFATEEFGEYSEDNAEKKSK